MILYIETSAVAKLLVEEPASSRLAARLDDDVAQGNAVLSSMLLETELRRLAVRVELAQACVTNLLARFDLGADVMVTYDQWQACAADAAGLPVLAP